MELNREQVVKALEKWMKNYDGKVTNFVTLGNAIGLIEELVKENERLQDLIKEVQQYNEAWVGDNGKLRKEMKTLRDDTVRKMQEKIRAKSEYGTINMSPWQLDQIAKELLEDNK